MNISKNLTVAQRTFIFFNACFGVDNLDSDIKEYNLCIN